MEHEIVGFRWRKSCVWCMFFFLVPLSRARLWQSDAEASVCVRQRSHSPRACWKSPKHLVQIARDGLAEPLWGISKTHTLKNTQKHTSCSYMKVLPTLFGGLGIWQPCHHFFFLLHLSNISVICTSYQVSVSVCVWAEDSWAESISGWDPVCPFRVSHFTIWNQSTK